MTSYLCITIQFLQPYSHGRDGNGNPEWPPSPLRLMQGLVAGSAGRWNERINLNRAIKALRHLETLSPPEIIGAEAIPCRIPYRLYVPDNVADKVTSISDYRAEKDVRQAHLADSSVHYLYRLPNGDFDGRELAAVMRQAARAMTHVGWGIDMIAGDASLLTSAQAGEIPGQRWEPSTAGDTPLRVPRTGTLCDLARKHSDFLNRVTKYGFRPVPPLREFAIVNYRRRDQPVGRPYRVFQLRDCSGELFRYPHRKLIHIAGMVRHLAVDLMEKDPPRDVPAEWAKTYVAGHPNADIEHHRQLSYLPLPSIGHVHADPGVRRVMLAAPVGDDMLLDYVARRLAGQVLKPDPEYPDPFVGGEPPMLIPLSQLVRDGVVSAYTKPANVWHSFTPVILPGHDDYKPGKTRALIERALRQSGIEQPCEFEYSTFSRFPKSYSAQKYDKHKRPQGYFRPSYLNSQTAVHLTLRFKDNVKVPGPLAIGAGRHCGLGLFATEQRA